MASIIQVFGLKKCNDTNKALRFFKERNLKTQFVDLKEKAMSKGELTSVMRSVPLEELMDTEGKRYAERNLAFIIHDPEEELLTDPLLLKTPVCRYGQKAAVGHKPEIWKKWADDTKSK